MAHNADYETCTVPFILKKGQSRKSAAFSIIANALAILELSMRHDDRRSRNYKLLLEIEGLGSLLELGKEVAALCVYTKPIINTLKMIINRRVLHRWEYRIKRGDRYSAYTSKVAPGGCKTCSYNLSNHFTVNC